MSRKRVTLVTGGAGFIGSRLVRALQARGDRVVVYDNFSTGSRASLPHDSAVETVEGDVRDAVRVNATLGAWCPTTVCHLAALHFMPYCEAHPDETRQVNVEGTRTVLAGCTRFLPERLLFVSSAAVYPIHDGRLSEEKHSPVPTGVYAETKAAAERLVVAFTARTGTATIIARPFNVFGVDEMTPHLITEIARQLFGGKEVRVGNLESVRDYVYVDDVVTAMMALIRQAGTLTQAGMPTVFNVGSGEGRSVLAVLRAIELVSGRKLHVVQDETRMRRVDRRALVADVAKLTRATGWRPAISFEDGLRYLLAGLSARESTEATT